MNDNETAAILARIDARLQALDKSDRAASMEAGCGAHAIRNLRRGSMPAIDFFTKLAPVLSTSPEFLAFGVGQAMAMGGAGQAMAMGASAYMFARQKHGYSGFSVPIITEVAAGQWLEVDDGLDEPVFEQLPVEPDPDYPVDAQFAAIVRGTSVNRVAPDGAILACVDTRKARISARERDLVIVEQRRHGGHEVSRTAKRYKFNDGVHELWPDSDDPRWTKPILIEPGEEEEGTSIEIIGIVLRIITLPKHHDRARRL